MPLNRREHIDERKMATRTTNGSVPDKLDDLGCFRTRKLRRCHTSLLDVPTSGGLYFDDDRNADLVGDRRVEVGLDFGGLYSDD